MPSQRTGMLFAFLAYAIWGLFPLYFKQLRGVDAFEVIAHRTLWSLLVLLSVLAVLRRWSWMRAVFAQPALLRASAISALLLSGNWLVYVWAVQNGHVVESSLGYFINPLVSVALGFIVLHERPRPLQWAAVGLAGVGVLWLAFGAGHVPWISLVLAVSFGFYGLMRKTATLGALEGLTLETLILAPIAAIALAWWCWSGTSPLVRGDPGDSQLIVWLLAAGPLTAVPLLLFASGARRITLMMLGLMQYIAPTLQFAIGVFVYGEPMSSSGLIGFAIIWTALALYSVEGLLRRRMG